MYLPFDHLSDTIVRVPLPLYVPFRLLAIASVNAYTTAVTEYSHVLRVNIPHVASYPLLLPTDVPPHLSATLRLSFIFPHPTSRVLLPLSVLFRLSKIASVNGIFLSLTPDHIARGFLSSGSTDRSSSAFIRDLTPFGHLFSSHQSRSSDFMCDLSHFGHIFHSTNRFLFPYL